MPSATVIPQLGYGDVSEAIDWLCAAFGFTTRLRIGNHRAQLNVGEGAIVVMEMTEERAAASSVMVRVDNVDSHHARARERGATIMSPPADFPYGERQYTVRDPGGHEWTFSQSIADVDPEAWGGVLGGI